MHLLVPLVKKKIPIGALTIYSEEVNAFDEDAKKLLIEMIKDVNFALENFTRKEELEESTRTRNKFIEIISHQLRTPLGVINWNLETLLKGDLGKLDETQEKFLKTTYDRAIETTSRIHDLLIAMDVEEKRIRYEKEDVSIDSLTAAVINEKRDECKLKNITCSYIPPEVDLPLITGDNEKIRLVITKLIDNAIAYTKENGKISLKLSQIAHNIRFEISDNGTGIPKQEQNRIFNRFFRGSNASLMLTDAFGLSLYLAKNFIEQCGGIIGFKSKEGEGSTFWFEIPVK